MVVVVEVIIHLLLTRTVQMLIMEWKQFLHQQAILVDPHRTLRLMAALLVVMVVMLQVR